MRKILLLFFCLIYISAYSQGIKLNGPVSAENNTISNVADPTESQDAATKAYIDALIASLQSQIDELDTGNNSGSSNLTDSEGNKYDYLTYGSQVWTVENAEMMTYADGTSIPQVLNSSQWKIITTGAWCYYDNDPTKGKLYNWYAVMGIHDTDPNTPNKKFAPDGWHVPTDAEWTALESFLMANGYNYDKTTTENKIAKSMASTTGWESSTNIGEIGFDPSFLNNGSGFNAFPVGFRSSGGVVNFVKEGREAVFWTSTEAGSDSSFYRNLFFTYTSLRRNTSKMQSGFSVRFIRD